MRFYLSSYKLGEKADELKRLAGSGKIGLITNALDFVEGPAKTESNLRDLALLESVGITAEFLDLKDYFGKESALLGKLNSLAGVFVRGGNTFVLRQAMRFSGFDSAIRKIKNPAFLYSGYSAGVCVLAPNLRGLAQVDNPNIFPYSGIKETVWEGLGLVDYLILPHFKSNHPESPAIDLEVEFCKKNKIPFRTLSDGQVIVL